MFSYDIKVRKINSASNLKAFVTLVIEGILEVEGFKVINGKNGLFVSVPSHKGSVMEDGIKVDKYFDDVRFIGEPGIEFSNELKSAILQAYNGASSADLKTNQAEAVKAKTSNVTKENESDAPERTRKPLWGF